MELINTQNIEKTKTLIKKSEHPIIVLAQNDKYNRAILEYGKFNILLGIERGNRKNSIRQVDSGLNHVLAKIASKNSVALGIDLEELSKLPKEKKALRLEKISQNIKTCRKAKTKLALINYKNKKDAVYFLLSLGASTKQAKETTAF